LLRIAIAIANPPLKNEGRRGPRSGWAEIRLIWAEIQ
jgi:hypothetical protein